MSTVLIHAGMPKTGSTSIQTWLRRHATRRREKDGISLLHVTDTAAGPTRFEAIEARMNANTISFVMLYHLTRQRPGATAELTALDDLWTPQAPEAALRYLYAALTDLMTGRSPG